MELGPTAARLAPERSTPAFLGTSAQPPRMGWLDALRGVAALVVVLDHSSYSYLPGFRQEMVQQFNTSRYGIMVFFLVSGYIIPASLERRGSVRAFWIGRVFRIYPLWAVVVTALLVAGLLGFAEVRGGRNAAVTALAHVTLFQELLGTPNLLIVLWTLSYEMAFYLLVVGLFTVRLHQRSAAISVALAVTAVVGVAAGIALPASALSNAIGTGPLVALASITVVVAICCACAGSPVPRVFGGVLGGVLALALVSLNGVVSVWEGLVILAVMFLGTAVYRAERGQTRWRNAACATAVVAACAVACACWQGDDSRFTRQGWTIAFLAALATFGVGLATRRLRTPGWLLGLGAISYSVYLVHPVLLAVSDGTFGREPRDNPLAEVAFFAVLLPLSVLTYRYVERPGRARGRDLAARAPARR